MEKRWMKKEWRRKKVVREETKNIFSDFSSRGN